MIKLLIVDDSALMRNIITKMIEDDGRIEIVGTAKTGVEAVLRVKELKPDVITLDIQMPEMDGVEALAEIIKVCPTPVIMLSRLTSRGAEITMECLRKGAVDFILKPSGAISLDPGKVREELVRKIHTASFARMTNTVEKVQRQEVNKTVPGRISSEADKIVIIGSSTGGPKALHYMVPLLPGKDDLAYILIQHMPPGLTKLLADGLNQESAEMFVSEAVDGEKILSGRVYVAPGNHHLVITSDKKLALIDDPPVWGVRPAIDVTMESGARVFKNRTIGILLTGMGRDGAKGLSIIRQFGGRTLAEDESTCIIFGMPKVAIEMGVVDKIIPLDGIPSALTAELSQ